MPNFQILCRVWKHVNSAKHWIASASKTELNNMDLLQFYNRWMICQCQISSVSFLVYTLLCVGRRTLTVGVWSPNWGVLGVYNITHCLQRKRQFARTGQISEFHIFAPPNAAQGACPRRHWQCYRILASERTVKHFLSSSVDCSRFGVCSVDDLELGQFKVIQC